MSLLDDILTPVPPSAQIVALDCESALIDAGLLDPPLACITWCSDDYVPGIEHGDACLGRLRALLTFHTIVGANIAYDMAVFMRRYPELRPLIFQAYREGRILDVQIAQRLVDIAHGRLGGYKDVRGFFVRYAYSLAALHERYGFGSLDKSEDTYRKRYGELIPVPLRDWPEAAVKYASDDAVATLKVWQAQQQYQELLDNLAAQCRAAFGLHLMSVVGMRTDAKACDEYMAELKEEIENARKLLLAEGLVRKDGTKDTKKAKARMLEVCRAHDLPLKPTKTATDRWRTPTQAQLIDSGLYSLDAEACRDSGDEVLQAYALFTSAAGLLGRAETLKKGSTGIPLQPRFQVLMDNGRTSCSAPGKDSPMIGDNLQNLPRGGKLRELFVPPIVNPWGIEAPEGYVFCSVDFAALEAVTWAQCEIWATGKSRMAEAINRGDDVHSRFVATWFRCSYEEALAGKKIKDSQYAKCRQNIAKAATYGFLGGLGAKRFMLTVNKQAQKPEDRIDLQTAQRARATHFETWDCQAYFDWCDTFLETGTATIKQFVTGRVRGNVGYTEIRNGWFSAVANDAATAGILPVWHECLVDTSSPLYGSIPQLFLHDEQLVAVRADRAHEAAFRLRDIMLEHAQPFTPDVKMSAEPAISRRWYKNADSVYDATGKLTLWEPKK